MADILLGGVAFWPRQDSLPLPWIQLLRVRDEVEPGRAVGRLCRARKRAQQGLIPARLLRDGHPGSILGAPWGPHG